MQFKTLLVSGDRKPIQVWSRAHEKAMEMAAAQEMSMSAWLTELILREYEDFQKAKAVPLAIDTPVAS